MDFLVTNSQFTPGAAVQCLNCHVEFHSYSTSCLPPTEELFQTYIDQFNVNVPLHSIWDSSNEEFPFCISCLMTIRILHKLQQQMLSLMENMEGLTNVLRSKLLDSINPRTGVRSLTKTEPEPWRWTSRDDFRIQAASSI